MEMRARVRRVRGLALLVLLGGAVEAVALPRAISLLGRDAQGTHRHSYVEGSSKYVAPEWGGDFHRYVGPFPVHFHGYVSGRLGF